MSLPYYRWRPYCGTSLLVYALELRQRNDDASYAMLRDLFVCIARHAREQYGVMNIPELPSNASKDSIVRAISSVSCNVRRSKRFHDEVHFIPDVEKFSDLLADAFKYFKGDKSARAEKAREEGYHLVSGCHNDGALFLEKHIPDNEGKNGGKPYRRIYIFTGNVHQLMCDFTSQHPEHLDSLYDLLHKELGHPGSAGSCSATMSGDETAEEADSASYRCNLQGGAAPAAAAEL